MTLVDMDTKPLRHHLTRCLLHNLIAALALACLLAIANSAPVTRSSRRRPHAEGSPVALIAANDCWTGAPPVHMRGVLPGRVVVTVDNVTRLGGERMVGKALDQVFGGVDHGMTVHAFCEAA